MVLHLMRKLSFEENFIALLGDNNVEGTPAPSSVRRLAQQNRIAQHNNYEATATRMPVMLHTNNWDLFLRFQLLRVLDIVEYSFHAGSHLEHLGDLLHLRYLGIRRCSGFVPDLPKRIGNLKLLQILHLDTHTRLPAGLVKLKKLMQWMGSET